MAHSHPQEAALWRDLDDPAKYAVAVVERYMASDLTDPDARRDVVVSTLQRAADDYAQLVRAKLGLGDLTHLDVTITGADGTTRRDQFRHLPTPVSLLLLLATNCAEGSRVELTQHAIGGERTVRDVWPFGLDVAEDMVRPIDAASVTVATRRDGIGRKVRSRKTRLGTFVYERQEGPPAWRFPKVSVDAGRSEQGWPYLSVGVGWRLVAHRVLWGATR